MWLILEQAGDASGARHPTITAPHLLLLLPLLCQRMWQSSGRTGRQAAGEPTGQPGRTSGTCCSGGAMQSRWQPARQRSHSNMTRCSFSSSPHTRQAHSSSSSASLQAGRAGNGLVWWGGGRSTVLWIAARGGWLGLGRAHAALAPCCAQPCPGPTPKPREQPQR